MYRFVDGSQSVFIGGRSKTYREVKLSLYRQRFRRRDRHYELNVGDAVMASEMPLLKVCRLCGTDYVVVKVVAPRSKQAEASAEGEENDRA